MSFTVGTIRLNRRLRNSRMFSEAMATSMANGLRSFAAFRFALGLGEQVVGVTHEGSWIFVRLTAHDPDGDALSAYSNLYVTPTPANVPAMDVERVDVSPAISAVTLEVRSRNPFSVV